MLDEFRAAGKEGMGVVLRVPVLYGPADEPGESAVNVLMETVIKSAMERTGTAKKVQMDHWALRFPTNTVDVGRVCHGMFFFFKKKFLSRPFYFFCLLVRTFL